METWDAVRARRNVRQYTDQPIPREQLEQILEAGRRSPSSSNWQPWHFVVVTDREQLVELAEAWPQGGTHIARSAATVAPGAPAPPARRPRSPWWPRTRRTSRSGSGSPTTSARRPRS